MGTSKISLLNSSPVSFSVEDSQILVVDDELGMREGCRKILSSEGFTVTTAEDGVIGIEKLKSGEPFIAAIVDLKMPRMGGLEFIEEAKKWSPDLLILVITAYATIDTAVEATKRGAYGYVPKPFTPDELLLPVRNGLERRALALETQRLKLEQEKGLLQVAYERSQCRTIFSCMTDAVLVINKDRKLVLRNAAVLRILPEASSYKLPTDIETISSQELRDLLLQTLSSTVASTILSREIDLGDCTYMVNASPVTEPAGEVLGAVAVLRDITALKRLEQTKSMFISMVAHEVKSPLAAIEGYLNVILSGLAGHDETQQRGMLDRARVRAEGLRNLINDLLSLSAMETGHFDIEREPLVLTQVLENAIEVAREKAESKSLSLDYKCSRELSNSPILADRQATHMILTNLIDNAIKYTPEGGHVEVIADGDDVLVKVRISDTGIGMTPEQRERIFDEFYRVKNQYTSQVPGTGLGLPLVKRLIDQHHGRITVDSEPGKGSCFTVSFPTARNDDL